MRIAVIGFKGGVGKTTTAVHLAAYFQDRAPTLLIDGDPNRSATDWARAGKLTFRVEDERKAARSGVARDFEHVVIDTEARPSPADLKDLAEDFQLLVVPSMPDMLSLKALVKTLSALSALGTNRYKVLLTICPPKPSHDAEEARSDLLSEGVPVFRSEIPRLACFTKAALGGVAVRDVRDVRASVAWAAYEMAGKEVERGKV
jgi:chromosome partitioning protein